MNSHNTHARPGKKQQPLPLPLSPKEKEVFEFLESYIVSKELAPTFQEICDHFGFASFNSVQRYIQQLTKKGYISVPGGNQKRAISLVNRRAPLSSNQVLQLPLYGKVAAGQPIESLEHDEFIDVPPSFVRYQDRTFALRVQGQSMIEDGIFNGDIILVQQQSYADNGSIAVVMTENEATVKRYFKHTNKKIELRPSNSSMQSMWFKESDIQVMGVVVGLMRRFS